MIKIFPGIKPPLSKHQEAFGKQCDEFCRPSTQEDTGRRRSLESLRSQACDRLNKSWAALDISGGLFCKPLLFQAKQADTVELARAERGEAS